MRYIQCMDHTKRSNWTHYVTLPTPFGETEFTILARCTSGWGGNYENPPESPECDWLAIEAEGVTVDPDVFFEILVASEGTEEAAFARQARIEDAILTDWNERVEDPDY